MEVLIANEAEYNLLNGYQNSQRRLDFAIAPNGFYYVGIEVLDEPYFSQIMDRLEALQRGEINP